VIVIEISAANGQQTADDDAEQDSHNGPPLPLLVNARRTARFLSRRLPEAFLRASGEVPKCRGGIL
jgi:hypothetical protein